MTFEQLKDWVYEERDAFHDSSERRHVLEFLADVVENVEYDVESENYSKAEAEQILRQQLIGVLEEFGYQCAQLLAELRKGFDA